MDREQEKMLENEISRITGEEVRKKHSLRKVSGYVPNKKKFHSPFKKFADIFFAEDLPTVKDGLIEEVIKPTIRDFMADIFIGGIERTLYGGSSKRSRKNRSSLTYGNSLVRSSVYDQRDYTRASSQMIEQKNDDKADKFNFDDVIMRDRASAQDLLDTLKAAITEYGNVSISELYDALDVTENVNFTDNYYGWTDLSNAQIKRVRTGWKIELPKPVSLK